MRLGAFQRRSVSDDEVAVRLGTLDRDPGIRPQYRQFVDSAAPWEPVPNDGLESYPRSRLGLTATRQPAPVSRSSESSRSHVTGPSRPVTSARTSAKSNQPFRRFFSALAAENFAALLAPM